MRDVELVSPFAFAQHDVLACIVGGYDIDVRLLMGSGIGAPPCAEHGCEKRQALCAVSAQEPLQADGFELFAHIRVKQGAKRPSLGDRFAVTILNIGEIRADDAYYLRLVYL